MLLDRPSPRSKLASPRQLAAALLVSAMAVVLVMAPTEARADDRCANKCAQKQTSCSSSCGKRAKCRQQCSNTADACFAQCQRNDDERQAARQRRNEKNCVGDDGRMRKCSADEEQQLNEAMKQASKMLCRDENGEQVLCPEQAKQIEESKKLMPTDCPETGCTDDEPE